MRARLALGLAALLVLAGCAAPVDQGAPSPVAERTETASPSDDAGSPGTADSGQADGSDSGAESTPDGSQESGDESVDNGDSAGDGPAADVDPIPVASAGPADPAVDVLGWEDGYWHNESIAVDQADGLTDAELDAMVGRAMARVEYLRGLEFTADVPVEVISREEHLGRNDWVEESASHSAWNNQVWEALFVVDESTDVSAELEALYGANVLGYYQPAEDRLVVVSDNDGPPVIDNGTLVHELVHALQDQQFDLTAPRYTGRTQDAELAGNGLTEGEANYVEALYADRCGEAWACVAPPQGSGGDEASGQVNLGLLVTVLQPYSDGPVYVNRLVETGGWAAVDAAHRDPPATTEQTIHVGRADQPPVDVTVADTARNGWTRFEHGVDGADTVGEASIYAMFWYQTTHYRIDVSDVGSLFATDEPYDIYNYNGTASEGWAGDAVVPYQRDGEYGYVWATEWDTPQDAAEFEAAYRQVLAGHGGERVGQYTWRIPEGGFADAFHVRRNGTRVTVVNAPTVDDLSDVRPGIETGPAPTTGGATTDDGATDGTTTGAATDGEMTDDTTNESTAPAVGR